MKTLKDIQLKRGTSINLSNWNGVLKSGEPVFDYDNKLKIGDGVTHYNDLPYICYNPDEIDIIVQGLDNRIIDLETIVSTLGTYIHYSNNTYKWDSSTILGADSGYKDDTSIDFVILSPALTAINKNTFSGCTNLKTIIFPESSLLTEIGESCFRNTSSLNNVVLPKTINKIGKNAFKGSGILYITIPNTNISSVGEDAFRDCVNLKEIELHCSGSVEIYGRTFSNCTSLKSVILSGIIQMNQYSFENDTNIEYLSITDSNVETRYGQFQNCTILKTAIITGVNRLAERTFYGCTSLSKVELSELMIEMGYYAFGNCSSLINLVVPATNNNSNNRIKNHALENSGITNLTLLNPNEQFESWSFDSTTKQRLTIYSYLDSVPQTLCSNLGINFKALLKNEIVDEVTNSNNPITSRAVLELSNSILNANKIYIVDYNNPNYNEAKIAKSNGKILLMYLYEQLYLCTTEDDNWLEFYSVNPPIYPDKDDISFHSASGGYFLYSNNTWVYSGVHELFSMDTEIYWATYGSTIYEEVENMVEDRLVLCEKDNKIYIYYATVPNQFIEFRCLIPNIHSSNNIFTYSSSFLHLAENDSWSFGTSTYDLLTQNYGSSLQTQINNLKAIGKFLSLWDCTTGLPESDPIDMPYTYNTGDYYIIGVIGSTNYKPTGSSYDGTPSVTVETTEIQVGDVFMYDGTTWLFQLNHQRLIPVDSALNSSSTNPVENRVVANAINSKADISTTLSGYGITDANIASGVITLGNNTITPVTVETDPVFTASPAATITPTMINNWNAAEANVQSDWNQTTTTADDYIKNKPAIINNLTSTSTTDVLSSAQGKALNDTKADKSNTLAGYGITDANINNGVITLGSQTITPVQAVSGKGLSTNDYTTAEKNKLAGIATGAEANVQSDWNQTNTAADDFIKNKPNLTQYVTKDELESIELTIATALNNLNNRVTALENA